MIFSVEAIADMPKLVLPGSPLWSFKHTLDKIYISINNLNKNHSYKWGTVYIHLYFLYNKMTNKNISECHMDQKLVKHLFDYNEKTGQLFWKNPTSYSLKPGDKAGTKQTRDGYIVVGFNKKKYLAHRLIWLWMTGSLPKNQIDHIDHVRDNNAWLNLRDVTQLENKRNQPISKANTSGATGVCWDKHREKWSCYIKVKGKKINLGRYDCKKEAMEERRRAEDYYGFHKNHGK